jgi:DNA-binding IclR family transcriptional regulator
MSDTKKSTADDGSRLFVTSLQRGLEVLTAFWEDRPAMTLSEIAQATGMSKSAAQRFTHTLWTLGYLDKNPTSKRFSLALRTLDCGLRYLQTDPLINSANPYLHSLSRDCGETCSVAEVDDLDMVYVVRFPAQREMFVNMPIGTRIPMYCTAAGRAVMSKMAPSDVLALLARSNRVPYTGTTITGVEQIVAEVEAARLRGFAFSNGEFFHSDLTVSAPITGPRGVPIGTVNISAPASRWTAEKIQEMLGPKVVETARAISTSKGVHRPYITPRPMSG